MRIRFSSAPAALLIGQVLRELVGRIGRYTDLNGRTVANHLANDGELLEVFSPNTATSGWTILKSLVTTVATPVKCPGRLAPHR